MTTDTKGQDPELAALMRLREEDVDTSDIPEVRDWSAAVVGKFYRPIKEPVTLRIDLDVLGWLKSEGPGYQTRINTLLRAAMTDDTRAEIPQVADFEGITSSESPQEFKFASLEKHGELEACNQVAAVIAMRGSVFAPVR
jgi:uncharacterized protein (DUF4415 family)